MKYNGFFDRHHCLYGEDEYLWIKLLLNERVAVYREPKAIVHSEASDLSRNLPGPRPIEVFLQSPEELFAACPPEKLELLEKLLSIRALRTAYYYAIYGRKADSVALLSRFCRRYKPAVSLRTAFAIKFSPIMPLLHACLIRSRELKI